MGYLNHLQAGKRGIVRQIENNNILNMAKRVRRLFLILQIFFPAQLAPLVRSYNTHRVNSGGEHSIY